MKDLTAEQITTLIEAPHESSIVPFIRAHASIKAVISALQTATSSHLRQVLCDILGYRHAKSALPLLIEALDDADMRVRCSAAESLGQIGDVRAGDALLRHFVQSTDLPEIRTLAVALGAVHYQPAVPLLIAALQHSDLSLRGCAAWSLGELRASEALPTLQHALSKERENYPRQRLQEAIRSITAP